MGIIVPYSNIEKEANIVRTCGSIVLCSCPADPLHIGHVRYLKESSNLGSFLFVIVNGNSFLMRKKGYVFMDSAERAEIISELSFVDYVSVYDADVQDVSGCILKIKPNFFCNGGDRKDESTSPIVEVEACKNVGAKQVWGMGGLTKLNSSSKMIEDIVRQKHISEFTRLTGRIKDLHL